MKVNLYEAGGRLEGGFTLPGMILTGPLLLSGNVTSPLEAVHKQYIDTAITNLNADHFTAGTIPIARMPAFTGDVSSSSGSNVIALNNSGVIAGDYTKVTVDAKGRITTGLSLTEADLPALSWDKITTGKPTTLSGYGITDAVSTSNGVITGFLTLKANPTQANHAATKQYADANVSGGAKIVLGDIVNFTTTTTPTGFLRCNGAEISKTTYSALYAVAGDTFSINHQPGAGQPWRKQYNVNNLQSGDITGWTTGTALPGALAESQAIVTKNRVYLLGGVNNVGAYASTVYTAPINSDGTLGAWTTGTSLPGNAGMAQAVVTKNRVYLLGIALNGNASTTTYTAPINTDGTLGAWTTGPVLPGALSYTQAVVTKNRVYLMGGTDSIGYTSVVYTAPINTDGTLGTWSTGTSIPATAAYAQAVVTKNRVYLIGGYNGGGIYSSAVYTAPINSDGTLGTWTTSVALPNTVSGSHVVVTTNRIYLLGGVVNGTNSSTVHTAPINVDGTLGAWSTGTALPANVRHSQVIATSSKIYLLGGDRSGSISTVYTASFSGGLNDYTSYYDGTITVTDSNNFKLPDYTSYEKTNMYFYIKA